MIKELQIQKEILETFKVKNMKLLLFIMIFLPCICLYGQENFLIKYKSIKDSDIYMVGEDVLYFSPKDNFSVYYEGDNVFYDERVSNDSVRFNSGDYYATYFETNELYFRTKIIDREFKVNEKKPMFNWKLIDETKEKDKTLLYKAKTSFRGRNYTAWYNPEIPITAGPWKFNGLPGLIYEIYDDAEEFKFSWYLSSLEKSKEIKLKSNLFRSVISIEKFAEELDQAYKNFKSTTDSRLPEYFNATETKVIGLENHRQKKKEIKYEWEE